MARPKTFLAILLSSVAMLVLTGCPHRHYDHHYPPPPDQHNNNHDHGGPHH